MNPRNIKIAKKAGLDIIIDVEISRMRLDEVMAMIEEYKEKHPGQKVWMDGDLQAIVAEVRG